MPVLLDAPGAARGPGLTVGLVNNMPDGALQATERQFTRLLERAAGRDPVRLRLYNLPGVPRGEAATARLRAAYAPAAALDRDAPDALIVTGCEPRAASLRHEPFWEPLARLADWAARRTASTLWSCLAAHAAVLHLDGVGRHRLPTKRSGVFACLPRAGHPLLRGAPKLLRMAHSRLNDLREDDLAGAGYAVLTASGQVGANLFVKDVGSLFAFVQGHPEYDADSLAREYRRDVARYLRGEREALPALPQNYFDAATVAALDAFATLATADRAAVGLRDLPRTLALEPGLAETWGDSTVPVFRAWLDLVADRAGVQRPSARLPAAVGGRADEAGALLTP